MPQSNYFEDKVHPTPVFNASDWANDKDLLDKYLPLPDAARYIFSHSERLSQTFPILQSYVPCAVEYRGKKLKPVSISRLLFRTDRDPFRSKRISLKLPVKRRAIYFDICVQRLRRSMLELIDSKELKFVLLGLDGKPFANRPEIRQAIYTDEAVFETSLVEHAGSLRVVLLKRESFDLHVRQLVTACEKPIKKLLGDEAWAAIGRFAEVLKANTPPHLVFTKQELFLASRTVVESTGRKLTHRKFDRTIWGGTRPPFAGLQLSTKPGQQASTRKDRAEAVLVSALAQFKEEKRRKDQQLIENARVISTH